MKTAVVVLAAGASSRMGEPKQLARFQGERMLERALRVAVGSELGPVIVVLGANAEKIQGECDLSAAQVVVNERWNEGMATSLQAGIASAARAGVDAAVVMTCDMPFVASEHLRKLAKLAESSGGNAASWSDGWRGIPACFRRESFAAIAELEGDTGGRALLAGAPTVGLFNGTDVDTPAELRLAEQAAAKIYT